MFTNRNHSGTINKLICRQTLIVSITTKKQVQNSNVSEGMATIWSSCNLFFLSILRLCSITSLFASCLLSHASPPAASPSPSLSLSVLFSLSLLVFLALFLWLQDYRAEGQSRCALDYEAEISLQSSCPAQFIKGGGGGGVWGRHRGSEKRRGGVD